jgi:FixJ family two-component response regulator
MEQLARVDLTTKEVTAVVSRVGDCIVWGGHVNLSPADDILIWVERPLGIDTHEQVVASILSKKIAAGLSYYCGAPASEDGGRPRRPERLGRVLSVQARHRRERFRPDMAIIDYNLPNGLSGLETVARLRKIVGRELPAPVLTGDISTATVREITAKGDLQCSKPARADDLLRLVQRNLAHVDPRATPSPLAATDQAALIYLVDDDKTVRATMQALLEHGGRKAEGHRLPAVMITGDGDVPIAVQAMRVGAVDFIEKPVGEAELLASIDRTLALAGAPGPAGGIPRGCRQEPR